MQLPPRLCFGTYRLKGARLRLAVEQALAAGVRDFDTAALYGNGLELCAFLRGHGVAEEVRVTSKVHASPTQVNDFCAQVEPLVRALGQPLHAVLLHHPMEDSELALRALDALLAAKLCRSVGVSNHSCTQLEALHTHAKELRVAQPVLNQIELHPFAMTHAALEDTIVRHEKLGVRLEAHSVMCGGTQFDRVQEALQPEAAALWTPAQWMVAWIRFKQIDVVFSSQKCLHLKQVRDAFHAGPTFCAINSDALAGSFRALDGLYKSLKFRLYRSRTILRQSLPLKQRAEMLALMANPLAVAKCLRADIEQLDNGKDGHLVSSVALHVPSSASRKSPNFALFQQVAFFFSFDADGIKPAFDPGADVCAEEAAASAARQRCVSRLRSVLQKLRCAYEAQARRSRLEAKSTHDGAMCTLQKSKSRIHRAPVFEVPFAVAEPAPMRVHIPKSDAPFREVCEFLAHTTAPLREPVRFERGAVFTDGRLDMCKQVVGAQFLLMLCDAVAKTDVVRHFLLGNNLAFVRNFSDAALREAGLRSLAALMQDERQRIETWYLAGNCIDADVMRVICPALARSPHARALWLKRNPLKAGGCQVLGEVVLRSQRLQLELLDVDNCGLLDEGLKALLQPSVRSSERTSLRHLYLSANGLQIGSVETLGRWLELHRNQLESLFLNVSYLGDAGIERICEALAQSTSLRRLSLASCALGDRGLAALDRMLRGNLKRLEFLDVGNWKSLQDLDSWDTANRFEDLAVVESFADAVRRSSIRVLRANWLEESADVLERTFARAADDAAPRVICIRNNREPAYRDVMSHEDFRAILQPVCVEHIQSIYRTSMKRQNDGS